MARTSVGTHELDKHRNPPIEAALNEKYGVIWEYNSAVSLSDIDIETSQSHQARFETNDAKVAEYREGFSRGDIFPAIIIHRPGRTRQAKYKVIDGLHRVLGALEAGLTHFAAYEIDQKTKVHTIALMTHSFNTRHGMPTSTAERISAGLFLVDMGASVEKAAEELSMPLKDLKLAVGKKKAEDRAKEAGVDPRVWEKLPQTGRKRIAMVSTDEGLVAAADLAYRAGLKVDEIDDVVTKLNATGRNGAKQKRMVNSLRTEFSDRIQTNGSGVLSSGKRSDKMNPKMVLSGALAQIDGLPEDSDQIVRLYLGEERTELAAKLRAAMEKMADWADLLETAE